MQKTSLVPRSAFLRPVKAAVLSIIRPDAAAEFFLFALFSLGVEHFGLGAAGTAAFLASDYFGGLTPGAFFA